MLELDKDFNAAITKIFKDLKIYSHNKCTDENLNRETEP